MKRVCFIGFIFGYFFLIFGCKSTDMSLAFGKNQIEDSNVVSCKNGLVRGVFNDDKSVELFAGIPFAKPPVGNLRWKEPQDVENWEGILEANHFAPMAMQHKKSKVYTTLFNKYVKSDGDRTDKADISEDCLYLNIWRPAGTSEGDNLPVLVYIHGGSLTSGSSWFESYDGESLSKKGIIFVTIAYRLGIFGYFAHEDLAKESPNHTTGNYGLLDQIKALKWINKNISCFGGDCSNITIAGESAGSSAVNALCASPLSKGLFQKAIGESSSLVVQVPAHTFRSQKMAFDMAHKIMDEFGVSSIEEMRSLPSKKLLKTNHANNAMTVDSYSMPDYPWEIYKKGENHEQALLNGFNLDEAKAFTLFSKINKKNLRSLVEESPYVTNDDSICNLREIKTNKDAKQLYTDLFSAICFTYPHYNWTKVVASQGKPVYEYCFTKQNKSIGAMHSGELIYAYQNLHYNSKKIFDESDYKLSEIMSNYWVNFAKYGNPNGNPHDSENALPVWEKSYSEQNPDGKVLELGEQIKMIDDPFLPFYQYFNFDIDKEDRPVTYGKKEE